MILNLHLLQTGQFACLYEEANDFHTAPKIYSFIGQFLKFNEINWQFDVQNNRKIDLQQLKNGRVKEISSSSFASLKPMLESVNKLIANTCLKTIDDAKDDLGRSLLVKVIQEESCQRLQLTTKALSILKSYKAPMCYYSIQKVKSWVNSFVDSCSLAIISTYKFWKTECCGMYDDFPR